MGVYVGGDECRVIYVARNGQQRRVSSVWVGDQQVFPPANRAEIHLFTRDTQGYRRADNADHYSFAVPVPWWATSLDVVMIGAGEKGRDGTKSFSGGSDGAGGKSGAWKVTTAALTSHDTAFIQLPKGNSVSPPPALLYLATPGGEAVIVSTEGEATSPNSGSTGGSVTPRSRTEYNQAHTGGGGGTRNSPGNHPGGGGGGGQGSNLLGNPQAGRDGGDGYVWLRFRSAPALNPGDDEFILRVGAISGYAYTPLREWAVGIGKTYRTITEITVPMEVIGPSLQSLFYNCESLTSVPEMDTSQVTDMYAMFQGCSSLASVPEMDTRQVTDMRSLFLNCSSLATIPALDTSQVTNMQSMFFYCSSLATIPALDTSQVTDMRNMLDGCSSLTSVPEMDTSQVTNMRSMFSGCSSLTTIPALDSGQVADIRFMFDYCSSLESVTLPGMGSGFTTGSVEAYRTLDMRTTKLNTAAANALMQSLGTPPPGGNLQLPSTATGADTSIAAAKNWTVTIG